MLEGEDVARRLPCSQSPVAQTFMVCARGESTMTYCDSRDDEEANHSEERHHYVVWNDGVEISRLIDCASHKGSRYGCKCQTPRNERDKRGAPWSPKRDRRKRGPGERFVRFNAHPGQRTRHVDVELVRRRILTGIQAFTAVVAEICEVGQVGGLERHPLLHRLKDGAVRFTVTARVAHDHLVLRLPHRVGEHVSHGGPAVSPYRGFRVRRSRRTRCRSSSPPRQHNPGRGCCQP